MAKLQLVTEWEKEHNKSYPTWGIVWHYDAYGESWVVEVWNDVKDFYEQERLKPAEKNQMWKFYFEPMVALPTDDSPKWGEGTPLKRAEKEA